MKAGIAIDSWKYPIFERLLQQSGYEFENAGAVTKDIIFLTVTTDNLEALAEVVAVASVEAAMTGATP